MPQSYSVVITTSLKPSETSRRVSRIFAHSIKNAYNLKRGKKTLEEILQFCEQYSTKKLLIITQKKNGEVHEIKFYRIKKGVAYEEAIRLQIWNIIDHYIYGYSSLPARAPISTGLEFTRLFPELTELFETYFGLLVNKFGEIWLVGDRNEKETMIQFVDPIKKLPFFSCNLTIKKK